MDRHLSLVDHQDRIEKERSWIDAIMWKDLYVEIVRGVTEKYRSRASLIKKAGKVWTVIDFQIGFA